MSDIQKIRKIEEEQHLLIEDEKKKNRERISRAEADASFRVGKVLQQKKQVIDEIIAKGREDVTREITFLKEENATKSETVLTAQKKRIDQAVDFVMTQLLK